MGIWYSYISPIINAIKDYKLLINKVFISTINGKQLSNQRSKHLFQFCINKIVHKP